MINVRRHYKRDWTWAYVMAFALVALTSYGFEKEIEFNQITLPVDYN